MAIVDPWVRENETRRARLLEQWVRIALYPPLLPDGSLLECYPATLPPDALAEFYASDGPSGAECVGDRVVNVALQG